MTQLVLKKIAPWPAGRILAAVYLVIGVFIAPFMFLAAVFTPEESGGERAIGIMISFFFPFLYAFLGLLSGVIGCACYNLFARMFGGVPVTFEGSTGVPRPEVAGQP